MAEILHNNLKKTKTFLCTDEFGQLNYTYKTSNALLNVAEGLNLHIIPKVKTVEIKPTQNKMISQ
jgi:hypothetical protein